MINRHFTEEMLMLLSRKRNDRIRRHNAQLSGKGDAATGPAPERRVTDDELFRIAGMKPRVVTARA